MALTLINQSICNKCRILIQYSLNQHNTANICAIIEPWKKVILMKPIQTSKLIFLIFEKKVIL